jgi:hypothetical protein
MIFENFRGETLLARASVRVFGPYVDVVKT